MTDLRELAERCEKATGPDRELERDMAYALGWAFERNKDACDDDDYGFLSDPYIWIDPTGQPQDGYPDWSSSLDAAMTLVPENCGVNIDNGPCHWICLGQKPMGRADVKYPKPGYDGEGDSWLTVSAIAATPALALCAAALKARASIQKGDGDGE